MNKQEEKFTQEDSMEEFTVDPSKPDGLKHLRELLASGGGRHIYGPQLTLEW